MQTAQPLPRQPTKPPVEPEQSGLQVPQSRGHRVQLSVPLQIPSPQNGQPAPPSAQVHGLQSFEQVEQVSRPVQFPSGQASGQVPQSDGQLVQVSVPLQVPSPQLMQAPQSCAQVEQVSPPLQTPSPQDGHAPQSSGQLEQVSLPLQLPLPQPGGQVPQSPEQVWQFSVPLQAPSPHTAAVGALQVSSPEQK